jgi:hypothetical protein
MCLMSVTPALQELRSFPGTQCTCYLSYIAGMSGMCHPDWPQKIDFEVFPFCLQGSMTLERLKAKCSVRDRRELTMPLTDLKLTWSRIFQMPNACSLWYAALLNISDSYCIRGAGEGCIFKFNMDSFYYWNVTCILRICKLLGVITLDIYLML